MESNNISAFLTQTIIVDITELQFFCHEMSCNSSNFAKHHSQFTLHFSILCIGANVRWTQSKQTDEQCLVLQNS